MIKILFRIAKTKELQSVRFMERTEICLGDDYIVAISDAESFCGGK